MTDVAPTASAVLGLPAPERARGAPIGPIVDDLAGADRVAVLAPDALGLFAFDLWRGEMPWLRARYEARGVVLRSVMPSITPVNFAAMVSGTDLDGHGVQTLKDPFACETLFDVVRDAGGRSAGIGLSGYTGSELLGRFADICGDAGKGTDDDVAEAVMEIAERDAPEFLIAQLGKVDDHFHRHGPTSPKVAPMLRETDARLRRLVEGLAPLGYGVVVLADHGQHDVVEPDNPRFLGTHGTDSDEDCLVPCTWFGARGA
jgi:hypothetical protein